MNEALDLVKNKELTERIMVAIESFHDDILPAVGETMDITASVYPKRLNVIRVAWTWGSRHRSGVEEFAYYPVETEENFINRIKAYLLDLTVMVINL